jgi:hypothetical protein
MQHEAVIETRQTRSKPSAAFALQLYSFSFGAFGVGIKRFKLEELSLS